MAGITAPTNTILIRGDPIVIEYKDGSTGALKPGDMCYISATNTISEGAAPTSSINLGIGVVGYEQASSYVKPATRATAYTSGCPAIPVLLCGSGCLVMAEVTDVTSSWALTGSASAGALVKGIIGTNHIYAIAMATKSGTGLSPVLLL
jgi:hypothetical protein